MDEIKQQLKWLSGFLDSITPVITEIKSAMTSKTRPLIATATLIWKWGGCWLDIYFVSCTNSVWRVPKENSKGGIQLACWHGKSGKQTATKRRGCNALISRIGKTTAKQMYEQRGTWLVDRSFPTLGIRLEVVLVKAEIFSSVRRDGRVIDCSYCGCPVHWKRYGTN